MHNSIRADPLREANGNKLTERENIASCLCRLAFFQAEGGKPLGRGVRIRAGPFLSCAHAKKVCVPLRWIPLSLVVRVEQNLFRDVTDAIFLSAPTRAHKPGCNLHPCNSPCCLVCVPMPGVFGLLPTVHALAIGLAESATTRLCPQGGAAPLVLGGIKNWTGVAKLT